VRGDEAQLTCRGRVSAAGNEHRAETADRGLAGRPLGERQQRMAGASFSVGVERALVGRGRLLGLEELVGLARAGRP
jgi:hypothetical protein